jgi:hypothetical protein
MKAEQEAKARAEQEAKVARARRTFRVIGLI